MRMVQIGLTPSEALCACNSPCTKQKLSYELNVCAAANGNAGSPVIIDTNDDTSLVASSITNSNSSSTSAKTKDSWWSRCIRKHSDGS